MSTSADREFASSSEVMEIHSALRYLLLDSCLPNEVGRNKGKQGRRIKFETKNYRSEQGQGYSFIDPANTSNCKENSWRVLNDSH